MCELKKHMDLHEGHRVETHIVELTMAEPYITPSDQDIIKTLLKVQIENYEQVSKVRAIIPAEKCLGFETHHGWRRQEAWLAVSDPNFAYFLSLVAAFSKSGNLMKNILTPPSRKWP